MNTSLKPFSYIGIIIALENRSLTRGARLKIVASEINKLTLELKEKQDIIINNQNKISIFLFNCLRKFRFSSTQIRIT